MSVASCGLVTFFLNVQATLLDGMSTLRLAEYADDPVGSYVIFSCLLRFSLGSSCLEMEQTANHKHIRFVGRTISRNGMLTAGGDYL